MFILFIIFLVIAYLIGSISSGVIVCKLFGLPDPRSEGSGSSGTTNVLRVGGSKAAVLVLVGDILKGFIPVFLASLFGLANMSLGFVGIAAILGHLYPAFFNFQGGKGVATSVGVWLALSLIFGILMIIVWAVVAFLSRYSSAASLTVAIASPLVGAFITNNISYFIPLAIIALIIIWTHHENITRLKSGTEPKIDFNKFKHT